MDRRDNLRHYVNVTPLLLRAGDRPMKDLAGRSAHAAGGTRRLKRARDFYLYREFIAVTLLLPTLILPDFYLIAPLCSAAVIYAAGGLEEGGNRLRRC